MVADWIFFALDATFAVGEVAIAALVLRAGAREAAPTLLAAHLAFLALANATSPLFLATTRQDLLLTLLFEIGTVGGSLLYLAFVASAVDSPLVGLLRGRGVRAALMAAVALLIGLAVFAPRTILLGAPIEFEDRLVWVRAEPYNAATVALLVVVPSFALIAGAHAWVRAPPGSVMRRRARMFCLAFGANDLSTLYFYFPASPQDDGYLSAAYALQAVSIVLLAYAILKWKLLDIEIRLKWTLRRGTLVAVFLATFFVVAAIAEQWLQRYGILVGGIGVGLLLFALRPIERAADRFAERAMPGVQATPEYLTFKRFEMYRAAVEAAQETGGIDDRERAKLERLRQKMGLSVGDATALEAEVRSRGGDVTPAR